MKGHIRERSPGHWAIVIDLRDPATGKRRRKWHGFAGTKRQAQIECARLISELSSGLYIEAARITVGQFLDRWLEHIKPLVSPRTHERYSELVTKNLKPLLGVVLLTKLRPMPNIRCLRQGTCRRPQGWPRRARPEHGALYARHPEGFDAAGDALANTGAQSSRCGRSSQDRARQHDYLRFGTDRRPDRCNARHTDDDHRHPGRSLRLTPRRDRGSALAQRQSRLGPTRGDRER
jgi:Phage integrase, N-terminal SAM-like domain